MGKTPKGQYGYIENQKKTRLLLCIAGLIIILADFFTGLIITGTRNNLFTVTAIVLALPEGKFLATYLVFVKYKSTPKSFFEKLEGKNNKYSIAYDLVFSTKERVVQSYAAVIGPDFVVCYSKDLKLEANQYRKQLETSLEGFVRAGKVKVKVSVLTEENAFFNRVDQLNASDKEISEYDNETIAMVRASVLAMCM